MLWGAHSDSPGVQHACARACSDVALGTGFKQLKTVSVGGGNCLGGFFYSPGTPRSCAACVRALDGQRQHSRSCSCSPWSMFDDLKKNYS